MRRREAVGIETSVLRVYDEAKSIEQLLAQPHLQQNGHGLVDDTIKGPWFFSAMQSVPTKTASGELNDGMMLVGVDGSSQTVWTCECSCGTLVISLAAEADC